MSILGFGVDAIAVDNLRLDHGHENKQFMKNIPLSQITIGNYQPRKPGTITKESIQDLLASIKELGILQPIIVRKIGCEQHELIAGERRYRSAYEAGLKEIPCIIKEVTEKDAFAIALIENIQREQLSLLEESESLRKLKEDHFLSIDEVSKLIGKPRTTVANLIRVASLLSTEGRLLWENKDVDYGHIRAVIMLSHKFQNILLKYIAEKKLSVRATEKMVREEKYYHLNDNHPKLSAANNQTDLNDNLRSIIKNFSSIHGGKTNIKTLSCGKVKVSIEFESMEKTFNYFKNEVSR